MSNGSVLKKPKRFYKTVSVSEGETGWVIELDGRTPITPAKKKLTLPTQALAVSVAEEWDSQGEDLELVGMSLTRLANVALDRTPETRDELVAEVQKYAGTDLVCYLADGPTELRERQEAHFRPIRDWAGREHNVLLMPTEGVMNAPQPPSSIEAVGVYAASKDDFALTGLGMGLSLFGSAVLTMAVAEGELTALDAYDISIIDEVWQMNQWGEDEEALKRLGGHRMEAAALGAWFEGLASGVVA
ncbi:ATP12 family chaperone protein [Ponticaulis sp.]|uniref:ATP12 family chaperone protein n=1 Tax=Ponticaulis sp. TaxID=2020902 RepID=UPI000B73C11C|nr:ATP12 family protein [Ponticaulis sp.]MAI89094.1 ATPase [Ponticaulis sp.]OUY01377.1 MAG: ATPase [Hyphomonadaceae bacterium TMED5]|tara:strand:+ start:9136 stop:9870 length:735 start_codon:yes stop_codon:yes gene_type:complete